MKDMDLEFMVKMDDKTALHFAAPKDYLRGGSNG